jgi:hypothetical protein
MEKTMEDWTVELSTTCMCEEDCVHGECWFDNVFRALDVQTEWAERNGANATETIKVSSERMLWNGVAGWTTAEHMSLHEALALNGDYRLVIRLQGTTLSATRYSHDEPVGAFFTVEFVPDDTEEV